MERLLLATLVIAMMAGCRGDKKATLSSALSQVDKNFGKPADTRPQAPSDDGQVKADVIAAVKQLKTILDANINGANPLRAEGKLIINGTSDEQELRKTVNDDLLYAYLDQRPDPKTALKTILDMAAAKNLNLNFEEARLVPTGLSDDANVAVDALLKRPKAASEVEIPIVLRSHTTFLSDNVSQFELYAMVVTNQAGHFQYFKLYDVFKKRPVGRILMNVTESNKPEDQKMILEFTLERNTTTNARLVEKTEYVSVLKVVPVKLN